MSNNDSHVGKTIELRKKAVESVRNKTVLTEEYIKSLSPVDIISIFHELQVHQIELDLQNEELRRAQSSLDRLRARYFNLYDLAPVGFCTITEKGLIIESNLTASTLLGTSRSELIQQPLSRFIFRDDQDIYFMYRKQLFDKREPLVCFLRMVRTTGTLFSARIESALANDDEGTPACLIAISDITAMKLLDNERELASYLALLNTPGDYRECMSDLTSILKNWSGCETVGIRLSSEYDFPYYETLGFSSEFIQSESRLCTYDQNGQVVLDGSGKPELKCFCGQVLCGRFDSSKPFFTPFGSFWTNSTRALIDESKETDRWSLTRNRCHDEGYESMALIPIRTDEKVWGLIQFNDHKPNRFTPEFITHIERLGVSLALALSRRQIKTVLMESEDRYATTLASVDDGLWDWNVQSGKSYLSPIYYSMLGYENGEFPASYDSVRQLVHPDDLEKAEKQRLQCLKYGKKVSLDLRMKKKTGEWLWVCLRGKTIESDAEGRTTRMVGTLSDITERKNSEDENARLQASLQQSQKMESVGRLAGGVAHDFNNMLGVILGHVEIALDHVGPDHPSHRDLTEIRMAAERSADLTQQLLAFARRQIIVPKVFDLNEIIEGILKMLRRLIGESIYLVWKPGSDLWPVKVDATQINQILVNLCVNAMDAINGVGQITIQTENITLGEEYGSAFESFISGDYVRLSVIDTGSGMDEETLRQIFEPFFTTKDVGKGTGLGLATVYGAVKQNGGFIQVKSKPGQGTVFEIILPRNQEEVEQEIHVLQDEAALHGNETILLVEDEPAILAITKILLERQGYHVLTAGKPDEAIHLVRDNAHKIHLLITDVVMPGMNGQDLVKSILTVNPDLKHLFMSGYTADVITRHGVLPPGAQFLEKPFTKKKLYYKVREVLDS